MKLFKKNRLKRFVYKLFGINKWKSDDCAITVEALNNIIKYLKNWSKENGKRA